MMTGPGRAKSLTCVLTGHLQMARAMHGPVHPAAEG